ncbi:MAG: TIGR02444 family protein, partial [Gammaproteobacteria bacterium]
MTSNFSLPKNEFWQYALKLYSKHVIKDTCLLLQDNYSINVNIILYCIWYATSARG